jgi:hypothetical protein
VSADQAAGAVPGDPPPTVPSRVRLALLWYPASWRARYGEEFAEVLIAERAERPRSPGRAANVAAAGLRARLASAGLAGHPLDPAAARRATLATLACAVAVLGTFGAAMWSQLAIGAQWAVPHDQGITQALDLMSGALAAFAVLTVLAVAAAAWTGLTMLARGRARPLLWPVGLVLASAATLVIGGRHFENGWPGTGGHLLLHQVGVPGGVAAFGWATTLWITSYWAHPAMLAAFPAAEVAWMVLCPAAACCLVTGAAALLRRLELSPRALCYEVWVSRLATASMIVFVGGALSWLAAADGTSGSLFHVGVIDEAGVAVLAVAVIVGSQAARRATVSWPGR